MNQPSLFDADVLPLFEQSQPDWLQSARAAARRLGASGKAITIDDVREVCPPPSDVDPRVMGAVFKHSEWTCTGHRRSRRRECHNRPVGVFVLKSNATP